MPAPVVRVAPPLDQLVLLERVEEADERTAIDVQGICDRPLGLA